MTQKELKLASHLLDMAADQFSNHGCNDLDEETLAVASFTPEEEKQFCAEIREWNGDPEGEWPERLTQVGDSSLMRFFAHKLSRSLIEPES